VSVEKGLESGTLVVVDGADKLREGAAVALVVREVPVAKARKPPAGAAGGGTPEERLKRWQELNARIDKGEFGEEIRKLPEEERKQKMRELRQQKAQ